MADFRISGRMSVENFKKQFKENFGATLRIYSGNKFADSKATLASIRKGGDKSGEFDVSGNMHVGTFENNVLKKFGIKVQVASSDNSKLVSDKISLSKCAKTVSSDKKNRDNEESVVDNMNNSAGVENEDKTPHGIRVILRDLADGYFYGADDTRKIFYDIKEAIPRCEPYAELFESLKVIYKNQIIDEPEFLELGEDENNSEDIMFLFEFKIEADIDRNVLNTLGNLVIEFGEGCESFGFYFYYILRDDIIQQLVEVVDYRFVPFERQEREIISKDYDEYKTFEKLLK